MAEIKKLQENGTDIYPATLEDAVFDTNGTSIKDKYQLKTDDALSTTDKTIIGSINELNTNKANAEDIPTKTSDLTNDSNFLTEHQDISNLQQKEDNTLSTTNKTIVGAINEVFQLGNNVKQGLVDALIAKDIEASTNESFNDLIGKVNNIEVSNNILPEWYTGEFWITAANMPTNRQFLTSSVIDNKIYCIGGHNSSSYLNKNECYIIIN